MQWSDIYVPVARMNNEFSNLIRTGDLFLGVNFTQPNFLAMQCTILSIDKMRSTPLIELKIG